MMQCAIRSGASRRGGYTLIELMIVVAILGLAGALLVPHLVGQDSLTVQAAVRQLIADLSFAQQDALAHQAPRRVHFYESGRGYCLLTNTTALPEDLVAGDYVDDPIARSGDSRYVRDFIIDGRFEGVTITSVNIDGGGEGIGNDGANIIYDSLGGTVGPLGLPGTGGTIVLTFGDVEYQITVSAFTGKLTVVRL